VFGKNVILWALEWVKIGVGASARGFFGLFDFSGKWAVFGAVFGPF
jgi:hypothetical protein